MVYAGVSSFQRLSDRFTWKKKMEKKEKRFSPRINTVSQQSTTVTRILRYQKKNGGPVSREDDYLSHRPPRRTRPTTTTTAENSEPVVCSEYNKYALQEVRCIFKHALRRVYQRVRVFKRTLF